MLGGFPSNAPSLGTGLWEGELTWWPPTCCSLAVLTDSARAGFAPAGTWVSSEAMGREGVLRLGTGLGRSGSRASRQGPIVPCRGRWLGHQ